MNRRRARQIAAELVLRTMKPEMTTTWESLSEADRNRVQVELYILEDVLAKRAGFDPQALRESIAKYCKVLES